MRAVDPRCRESALGGLWARLGGRTPRSGRLLESTRKDQMARRRCLSGLALAPPRSRNYDVALPLPAKPPPPFSILSPSPSDPAGRAKPSSELGSSPDPHPSPCPLPDPSPRPWSPLSRSHASPAAAYPPSRTLRRLPARLEQAPRLGPGQSGDLRRMTAESAEGGETLRHPGRPLLSQPGDEIPPWSRP